MDDVTRLVERLTHEAPCVRVQAAETLGESGDAQAVEPLILAMRDDAPEVRRAAAEALGRLGGDRAFDALTVRLKDTDRQVRKAAALALAQAGESRAIIPLIEMLRSGTDLSGVAAEALGRVGDHRAISPLIDALYDRRPEAPCVVAAEALGLIAQRDSAPQLREVLPYLRMMFQAPQLEHEYRTYHTAFHRIEEATAALKDLPLPADARPVPVETLPLPSSSSASTDSLPLPSSEPEPSGAAPQKKRGWFTHRQK